MAIVVEQAPRLSVDATCKAFGVPRATYYRKRAPQQGPKPRRPAPPRRIPDKLRKEIITVLSEDRFADLAPAEVYATLQEEKRYLCSIRSMHRILAENIEVRDRRNQLSHPVYARPELLADGPNQLSSWDITKLLGPKRWNYFHLYVILDVFSRYVVGWLVADRESTPLAEKLISNTYTRQRVRPGKLTLHTDRGSSMKSKGVALLLADLGVTNTHSRPRMSDDNPHSEPHFKTLKCRPGFPKRFGSLEDARSFCQDFFAWYNGEHHHSGLELLTPADVHHGLVEQRVAERQAVLDRAFAAHPERFPHGCPRARRPAGAVWLNKPVQPDSQKAALSTASENDAAKAA